MKNYLNKKKVNDLLNELEIALFSEEITNQNSSYRLILLMKLKELKFWVNE